MSVVTGASGAFVTVDATQGVKGATGAPAQLVSAQYYMTAGSGGDYGDKSYIPYFGVHQEPPNDSTGTKSIRMDDRTLVLRDSGNYLINFSLASNGTNGIPNIHILVDDATGSKDYNFINVMPQGMTSGAMVVPISGPGRIRFQVQGSGATVKVPSNAPMGELSVVKIG
jgi:hypothetical protein